MRNIFAIDFIVMSPGQDIPAAIEIAVIILAVFASKIERGSARRIGHQNIGGAFLFPKGSCSLYSRAWLAHIVTLIRSPRACRIFQPRKPFQIGQTVVSFVPPSPLSRPHT